MAELDMASQGATDYLTRITWRLVRVRRDAARPGRVRRELVVRGAVRRGSARSHGVPDKAHVARIGKARHGLAGCCTAGQGTG